MNTNEVLMNETMGWRIKEQRKRMHMTQEQVAELMCIPKSTISAYENDKVDIKSSVIIELSHVLNTSPNYLLGMEECDKEFNDTVRLLKSIKNDEIRKSLMAHISTLSSL